MPIDDDDADADDDDDDDDDDYDSVVSTVSGVCCFHEDGAEEHLQVCSQNLICSRACPLSS